jgi:hypothetical protein
MKVPLSGTIEKQHEEPVLTLKSTLPTAGRGGTGLHLGSIFAPSINHARPWPRYFEAQGRNGNVLTFCHTQDGKTKTGGEKYSLRKESNGTDSHYILFY